MALFANLHKEGQFHHVRHRCPNRVALRADRCLGCKFAIAPVISMFSPFNGCGGCCCGVGFGDKKGFHVGFNTMLPTWRHQDIESFKGTRSIYHYHGQRRCALVRSNSSDWPPRNTKTANKMMWMMTVRPLRRRRMSWSSSSSTLQPPP